MKPRPKRWYGNKLGQRRPKTGSRSRGRLGIMRPLRPCTFRGPRWGPRWGSLRPTALLWASRRKYSTVPATLQATSQNGGSRSCSWLRNSSLSLRSCWANLKYWRYLPSPTLARLGISSRPFTHSSPKSATTSTKRSTAKFQNRTNIWRKRSSVTKMPRNYWNGSGTQKLKLHLWWSKAENKNSNWRKLGTL